MRSTGNLLPSHGSLSHRLSSLRSWLPRWRYQLAVGVSSPRRLAANVRLSESVDTLPLHKHNVLGATLPLPMTYALRYSYHKPTIGNDVVEFNNRDHNSNLHLKHGVFRVGRASRLVLALQHQPPRSAQQLEKITPTLHTNNSHQQFTPTIHTENHIETPTNINTAPPQP
jgi:hypothetical protein